MRTMAIYKKRIAVLVAVLLTISYIGTSVRAESETGVYMSILEGRNTADHISYLEKYEYASYPVAAISLSVQNSLSAEGDYNIADDAFVVGNGATFHWNIEVEESGLYPLYATYKYTDTESIVNLTAEIRIDDELPFTEASELSLTRIWKNGEVKQDLVGNDLLPEQIQISQKTSTVFTDETGKSDVYYFYLEQGTHTVSCSFDDGGILLYGLIFENKEVPDYSQYSKKFISAKSEEALNYYSQIQAEDMIYKNDSAIVSAKDRSGPDIVPSDPYCLKLNVLSGDGYSTPGQSATWEFTVPEDGKYRIGIHSMQSDAEGLAVYRNLKIDGETLFSEMDGWSFPYTEDWTYTEFGGAEPYYFYLTEGTHTLTMEVSAGEMGKIESRLEDAVYALNYLYRKILVITGSTPDNYRDYSLDKEIPELIPTFKEIKAELADIYDAASAIVGKSGGQTSVLKQIEELLGDFIDDPAIIPSRLSYYTSNVSSVASLMQTLQSQPLDVDYITVLGENVEAPKTKSGFFKSLVYHFCSFIGSFSGEYTTLSTQSGDGEGKNGQITAWYNGGREAMEIIKQVIDEKFTEQTGVSVELKLVQISLTQAVLAGTAPDVVLNVSRGQPINLGLRDVLEPLQSYDGFDELKMHYYDDAFVPYTYGQEVYALPISCDFHVMFYRKDILAELGIEIPQTWDDVYSIFPVLQRNNMSIAIPYSTLSSQAAIDSGIGAKDVFPALLMQRGGSVYNEETTALALDSEAASSAFKEWVELYTQYGLELSYDFYNRFRMGEMPLGITSYSFYNQLSATAPEIKGLWAFTYIPGTLQEDGSIDRSEGSTGSAAVMVRGSKSKEVAWTFLKWWAGCEAQSVTANRIEALMGPASRANPANTDALCCLAWSAEETEVLLGQMKCIKEIPEVAGGYYVSRGLDNAFRNVAYNSKNYRESLMEQIDIVNDELERKQKEIFAVRKRSDG